MWATPYLALDVATVRRNIATAQAQADAAGYQLRPHVKTHKCVQLAQLQIDAGARGITVATIGEAELFAAHGFDDIFIAYPLWPDDDKARRLRELSQQATLRLGVDSAEALHNYAAQGIAAQILVEIDSGMHRSGIAPAAVVELPEYAELPIIGVFTFPGHSYAPQGRAAAAGQEAAALALARDTFAAAGRPVSVISGGSSPSMEFADGQVLTESRPGVYVVNDAQQWELGACGPESVGLWCVATVVSHANGRVIADAGSKALGADKAAWASGYGRLLDHHEARIVALSEHHATIEWPGTLPALGSTIRIVPNHACNAINLAESLCAITEVGQLECWPVAARGRNS
ncbi:MAG: alanine racemase [Propionibacteriaceae bacterium]